MPKTLQQLSDYIGTEPEIRSLINETVKYLKDAWPPEGSTQVTVYQRKTILTNDQIKALPTTYDELLPTPEAGRMFVFHSALVVAKLVEVYTNNDNPSMAIVYGDWDVDASATAFVNDLLTNNNAYYAQLFTPIPQNGGDGVINISNFESKPLKIVMENGLGNFTGGDPANTLEVTVFYSIVDL